MDLKKLNVICYAICIISIVFGVILSLAIIWGQVQGETAWKSWATIGVFFTASLLTLSVNRIIENKNKE